MAYRMQGPDAEWMGLEHLGVLRTGVQQASVLLYPRQSQFVPGVIINSYPLSLSTVTWFGS